MTRRDSNSPIILAGSQRTYYVVLVSSKCPSRGSPRMHKTRMRRYTPSSLESILRSARSSPWESLGETLPKEPSLRPGVSRSRNKCVRLGVSQWWHFGRRVTPQASLAMSATVPSAIRLMKELLPTPGSPATTMLRGRSCERGPGDRGMFCVTEKAMQNKQQGHVSWSGPTWMIGSPIAIGVGDVW